MLDVSGYDIQLVNSLSDVERVVYMMMPLEINAFIRPELLLKAR